MNDLHHHAGCGRDMAELTHPSIYRQQWESLTIYVHELPPAGMPHPGPRVMRPTPIPGCDDTALRDDTA